MRDVLAAFRFQEGDTLLHRLDPRAKLLVTATLVLFLWLRTEILILAWAAVPLLALVAVGRLARPMAASLRAYGLLGLLLVPLNALLYSVYGTPTGADLTVLVRLTPPETPLLGALILTRGALEFSLFVYLRLVLMLVAVSVFVMSTDLDGVEALLYRLRFPDFFVLTLTSALRFLPTLAEEAERIQDAQRVRGLDPREGDALRRGRNAFRLLVPLVVSVLRRSLRLAEALETRGTFVHPRRTVLSELRFRRGDVLVSASALGCLGVSVLLLVLWPLL